MTDLKSLPAVQKHGRGINSAELADFHRAFTDLGKARFLGIGSEQYARGGGQKFEQMTRSQLANELLEEIMDVQNYCTMMAIKVIAAVEGEE